MAGLGDALRAARERRGLTLPDAERECKVRRVFLEALEEERFDLLPARAFAQGLLTVYARYLGLDPYPLIQLLPPDPTTEPEVMAAPPAPSRAPWRAGVLAGIFLLAGAAAYVWAQAATTPPRDDGLVVTLPSPTSTAAATATPQATSEVSVTATTTATLTPTPAPPTATPTAATPTPTVAPNATVPGVTGVSLAQAATALQAAGLVAATEDRYSPTVPAGTVIEQRPPPGTTIQRGQSVALVISRGPQPIVVPNVVGMSEPQARSLLTGAGLRPNQFTNYQGRDDLPAATLTRVCSGCVLSTAPLPGTEVPPNTEVQIAVARY